MHVFALPAGRDEYSLVEALRAGRITKPVVAWVRCGLLGIREFHSHGMAMGSSLGWAAACKFE